MVCFLFWKSCCFAETVVITYLFFHWLISFEDRVDVYVGMILTKQICKIFTVSLSPLELFSHRITVVYNKFTLTEFKFSLSSSVLSFIIKQKLYVFYVAFKKY